MTKNGRAAAIRIFVGVAVVLITGAIVGTFSWAKGHESKPAHDVAAEQIGNLQADQHEIKATIDRVDQKVDALVTNDAVQNRILERIERKLDEPP